MTLLKKQRRAPAAALVCLMSTGYLFAQTEYSVKAAYLHHFAQFTSWPPTAFESRDSPIRICVLGIDPFGATLDRTLEGEQVEGHALIAVRVQRVEQVSACHVVFISESQRDRLASILSQVHGPILTVADTPGFLEAGGMVNLVMENRRIRFDVNLRAAQRAGVQLSSKLLNVARTVRSAGN